MATEQTAVKDCEVQRRVRGQVKVMEAVLARLSEEETEIKRQRQDTEDDIYKRYVAGLRHLGEARDQCLMSLKDAAQVAQDKVVAERATTESKLSSLSQVAQSTDMEGQDWETTQAALLSPSALRHFQQLSQKTGRIKYFSYCPDHSLTPSLIYSCTQFMGAVLPAGRPRDVTAGNTTSEAAPAPPDPHLTQQVQNLRADMDSLRENQLTNTNLLHDVTNLRADLERLDDRPVIRLYRQLCNGLPSAWFLLLALCLLITNLGFQRDIPALQDSLDELHSQLHSLDAKHALDIQRLEMETTRESSAVHNDSAKSEKRMAALERNVQDIHNKFQSQLSSVDSLQKELAAVQRLLANSSAAVTFHAGLIDSVRTSGPQRLVLPYVLTNTGRGYDPQTGIFTAPVSGTYLFLASAMPWAVKRSFFRIIVDFLSLANASPWGGGDKSVFSIKLEDKELGIAVATGGNMGTGHVMAEVTAGQRVWMHTGPGELSFWGGVTYFTGMLVQAKTQ